MFILPCFHLQLQCNCICHRLENHFIKFGKIVHKLIVSSYSMRVKEFSHGEIKCFFFFFFFFNDFSGLRIRYMEVSRLEVESELPLLACATATATQDPSLACDLHHSSWQHRILNPLRGARFLTFILMDTSWVHYH